MWDQIVGLKHKSDRVIAVMIPVPVLIFLRRFVGDGQIALRIAIQSADDIQQRGFAAAGRSQHGNKLILPELNINSLERLNLRITRKIILRNSLQSQQSNTTFPLCISVSRNLPKYHMEYTMRL